MDQEKSTEKRRLIIFVTLTIVIAWIELLLIPIWGLPYASGLSVVILAAVMFVPPGL